jgi:hypothetical protein
MMVALGLFLFTQATQADWTPAKRLTWNSGFSFAPDIVVDSAGNPHIVWNDDTPGNYEIYHKKSFDGGATWATSRNLTWNSGGSYSPAITFDSSGNFHLFWGDDTPGNSEIYNKKSTDGGATWTTGKRFTWTSGNSASPAIALDSSGNFYLFWEDNTPGNFEIYYKKSADGGATWTTGKRLTWHSGDLWGKDIAVDSSGNLHLAWCDHIDLSHSDIYYKKSTDGGTTWSTSQRLTWTSASSLAPAITADGYGNLHVVWREESTPSGNWEIYYKKSPDGGTTWLTSQRLTWTSGGSIDPDIAVDSSGNLHLVWAGDPPSEPYALELYYKKSTDGGTAWTSGQRLTWVTGLLNQPVIAIDSYDNLHVVFYVATGGNSEIYYKKYIK